MSIRAHLVDELVDIEAFGHAACHALLSKLDKPIDDTLLGVEAAQTFAASLRNAFEPALIDKATCNLLCRAEVDGCVSGVGFGHRRALFRMP